MEAASFANLECVEEQTSADAILRRVVTESWGRYVWRTLWETVDFSANVEPDQERIRVLREKIVPILRGLEKSDYAGFCWEAHRYADCYRDKVGDIFPNLPRIEEVQREYQGQLDSLDQRVQNIRMWDRKIPVVVGALTFVGGAIGAGYLGEYLLDRQYISSVFAAGGGLLSGVIGDLATTLSFEAYESRIHKQREEIKDDIHKTFAARVKKYYLSE